MRSHTITRHTDILLVPATLMLLLLAEREADAQVRQPRGSAAPKLPAVKSIIAGALLKTGTSAGSATGGQEVVLRVQLTGPAPCVERCGGKTVNGLPSGYMRVTLSTDNATQFSLQQMFVNTGQTTGEAKFVPVPVVSPSAFTISAWTEGSPPQRARLTVQPPVMTHFALAKSDAVSGETVKGVVHFSGPPASAGAVKFQVQTTNGQAVKVPASVALEPNKTVAEFDIATLGVSQDRNAHVVAFYLGKTLPAPLTVRAARLATVENANDPYAIAIGLDGLPPPQGAIVQLTSANPARITVPPSVTIPPGATSLVVRPQSIPGNSDTNVRITVSYNGVSKHASVWSNEMVQPDLVLRDITFYDEYSNVITAATNGQPIKMCVKVYVHRDEGVWPNVPVPPSVLRITYQSPTATGTASGRTTDYPVVFPPPSNVMTPHFIAHCIGLPGIAQGNQIDITVVADVRNEVDESREGNNTEKVKISRP